MARTIYTDSSLSVEDQIRLLKSRNLTFLNEEKAKHLLQNVSMFRMKGYLYPLQSDRVHHIYRNGATFEQAFELYSFDSNLRRLIFKRIEQIEVSVRTKFSEIMNLRIQPVTPRRFAHPFVTQPVRTDRIYYVMCIIKYLLNIIEHSIE